MGYIFDNPTDNMNHRKFEIYVTGLYEPLLPEYFKNSNMDPFYNDIDSYGISFVPPATIVDLCYHNKEFTIKNIDDTYQIMLILESYINLAELAPVQEQDIKSYILRCKTAYKKLKEVYDAYLNYLRNKFPDKYHEKLSLLDILNNRKLTKV